MPFWCLFICMLYVFPLWKTVVSSLYSSGPLPFWHQGLVSRKTIFHRMRVVEWGGGGAGEQWAYWPATHFLLCSQVPNRLCTGSGRVGWGPLFSSVLDHPQPETHLPGHLAGVAQSDTTEAT